MNTPSQVAQESPATPQGMASVAASALRPMYWSGAPLITGKPFALSLRRSRVPQRSFSSGLSST